MAPRTMWRAKDGIKLYSRVLGGFNHMLYGAVDARTSETSSIQSQKTLMHSSIQASPVLGGLRGGLLTAASLSDKFHLIKVEKGQISGNFHQETPLGIALFAQAHRISWMSQECQSFSFSARACIA